MWVLILDQYNEPSTSEAFKWSQTDANWTDTVKDGVCFLLNFYVFYKLFCPMSQNKPGWHKYICCDLYRRHSFSCAVPSL